VDAGAIFLGAYVAFQHARCSFKISDRGFGMLDLLARGLDAGERGAPCGGRIL
jgi:hypothetical protein